MAVSSYLTKKKHFLNRLEALKTERNKIEGDAREISDYLAPQTGMFGEPVSEKDKKRKFDFKKIINTYPSYYINNLATAIVMNLTPSRLKWFRLKVPDMTREEEIYLLEASNRMYSIFTSAGLYENLYGSFKEAILYGINLLGMTKDYDDYITFVPMTFGEYYVDENSKGKIDTCYRTFAMSNIQLFEKFGDAIPESIKAKLEKDNTEELHTVIHAVEPNPRYLSNFDGALNKPYISAYFLEDVKSDDFLEYKGLSYFPYMVARWDKSKTSYYGSGVGELIIGDVKSLQAYESDLAKASKKKIDPPLKGSSQLRNAVKDVSAKGITYVDDPTGFTPLYNVNYETREALENITRIQQRIYQTTFNDLFYALINKDKSMSATEAKGVEQEKLTMLGSVVERLENEFLQNLVEVSFTMFYEQGVFGEPPASLIGKEMKIEYTSLLAMSQDINDLSLLERWLRFVSQLAAINPEAARKPDILSICDFYGSKLGIDLKLTRTNEEVIRQEQEEKAIQGQIAQANEQRENVLAQAKAAKDFSAVQSNSQQALSEILNG